MSARSKHDAVYEQFLATPEYKVAEIIHGTLITHPRPAARHAAAASLLGATLVGTFWHGSAGGWVILDEPELHLGDDILVPDLAGWRRERMPEMPDVVGFELPPDWICEVLSPSTAIMDRADKLPIYAQRGISHAWLVDPLAQTLGVFERSGEHWRAIATHRDQALIRAAPFEALEWSLGSLWAR